MTTLARVARRLAWAVPMLAVVSFLTFFLVSLTPGNAALTILGPSASPAQVQALRTQMGLNKPLLAQYWGWLSGALHGSLGNSLVTGTPVASYLDSSLAPTLSLVGLAIVVSAVLGMALGVASAVRGGALGRGLDALSFAGLAVPSYWLALLLISLFADHWHLFPAVGYVPITQSPLEWLRSLVLPVCAASLLGVAAVAKQTRDSMLDALSRDFVRFLQANGLPRRSVIYRHAMRNAAIPVVTLLAVIAVALLSAVVFVEIIFSLPGLGSVATLAAQQHDLPVLQGAVVYFTLIVVVINLLVDLSYSWLDPRVRQR
jgi:peptide/nickel transport system permease protein